MHQNNTQFLYLPKCIPFDNNEVILIKNNKLKFFLELITIIIISALQKLTTCCEM